MYPVNELELRVSNSLAEGFGDRPFCIINSSVVGLKKSQIQHSRILMNPT